MVALALATVLALTVLVYYLLPAGYAAAYLPAVILVLAMILQTVAELPGIYLLVHHFERQLLACWIGISGELRTGVLADRVGAVRWSPDARLLAAPLATLAALVTGQGLLLVAAFRQARRNAAQSLESMLTVLAES